VRPKEVAVLYLVVTHESGQWTIKIVTPIQEEAYRLAEEAGGMVAAIAVERSWTQP
jgi:hypothetical protein